MFATGTGAAAAGDDAAGAPPRDGGRPRLGDVSVEAILALPATWGNVRAVFHHMWGLSKEGTYDKRKWSAYASLLERFHARVS